MNFCLVGMNHKTAPVEVRERIAIPDDHVPDALHRVAALPDVQEVFVLSTCNRVEIFARAERDEGTLSAALIQFLADYHRREFAEVEPYCYHYRQREAI